MAALGVQMHLRRNPSFLQRNVVGQRVVDVFRGHPQPAAKTWPAGAPYAVSACGAFDIAFFLVVLLSAKKCRLTRPGKYVQETT
jgi:hypothetical protein